MEEENKGTWKCRFCKKRFPKFNGYENIEAIEEFTHSVRRRMYKRIDNEDYEPYIKHLCINHNSKYAYCKNAVCNDGKCEMRTFKSYISRYMHDKKHHLCEKVDALTEQQAMNLLIAKGYVIIKKEDYEKEKYYNKMKSDMEEKIEKRDLKEKEKKEKKQKKLEEKEAKKKEIKEKKEKVENNITIDVTKDTKFNKTLLLNLEYLNLIDDGKANWNYKIEPFMEEMEIEPHELYYDDKTIYLRDEDGDDVGVFKIVEYTFERIV
jgi:hypothetical protein